MGNLVFGPQAHRNGTPRIIDRPDDLSTGRAPAERLHHDPPPVKSAASESSMERVPSSR